MQALIQPSFSKKVEPTLSNFLIYEADLVTTRNKIFDDSTLEIKVYAKLAISKQRFT